MARLRLTLGGRQGGPLPHSSYTTPRDTTGAAGSCGAKACSEAPTPPVDMKLPDAHIKNLTMENEFSYSALSKARLLNAKR